MQQAGSPLGADGGVGGAQLFIRPHRGPCFDLCAPAPCFDLLRTPLILAAQRPLASSVRSTCIRAGGARHNAALSTAGHRPVITQRYVQSRDSARRDEARDLPPALRYPRPSGPHELSSSHSRAHWPPQTLRCQSWPQARISGPLRHGTSSFVKVSGRMARTALPCVLGRSANG